LSTLYLFFPHYPPPGELKSAYV